MLIDEILVGISTASKESTYAETVLTDPANLNREICLLLTNHNGFLLFIIYSDILHDVSGKVFQQGFSVILKEILTIE